MNPYATMSRQDQIVVHFRDAILEGRAAPGSRLPSSRVLAADLRIARQTVVLAYESLIADELVVSRPGSGLYVSLVPAANILAPLAVAPQGGEAAEQKRPTLSRRGQDLVRLAVTPARRVPGLLTPGLPALDLFPHATWSRLAARFWRSRPGFDRLGYTDPVGLPALREAVAAHLGATRGLACSADDVVVTAGSQQAIALAARILLDPGDSALVEEPAYVAGRSALAAAGARLCPVPVDDAGMDVERGERATPGARLALVTPSHQYPLGVTMSLDRRLSLLRWAEAADRWIIEDDYDGDFRYGGRPLRPLRALASHGASKRVVYVGTFAKVLAPALRLGFLVAPDGLAMAFSAARALADRQPAEPLQATLAAFIGEGHLSAHLRRMRGAYAERRDALLAALRSICPDHLDLRENRVEAGLHLTTTLRDPLADDVGISAEASLLGVQVPPLSGYSLGKGRPGLVLGFAATSVDRMPDAVRRLRRAIDRSGVCGGSRHYSVEA